MRLRERYIVTAMSKQAKLTAFFGDFSATSATESQVEGPSEKGLSGEREQRNFQRKWLSLYTWLRYDEVADKMHCQVCASAGKKNAMAMGTDNFKTSTLTRHVNGGDHTNILLDQSQKKNFEKATRKVLNDQEKAIMVALKTVYFLAKEGLPLIKYPSLIGFLKELETPNVNHLSVNDRVDYTSNTTAVSLLTALSNVLDIELNKKLKDSPVITILTDESTDIVVHHKLAINVRIVDPLTLIPKTHFLTDVRLHEGTGKAIFKAIEGELKSRNVDVKKVMGLGTDGASTMVGTKEGLAGHFLRQNPHIVNTHCVAHRLALCSEQAAKKVPQMVEFQRTMELIFYHFKKSPKKIDRMEEIQKVLEEPVLKYREVHQIRWLSFYQAIDATYRTLDSLITYFYTSASDPSAEGLKRRVGQELFVSLVYAMMDILQPIMALSLTFQKKDLDLGIVQVSVNECVRALEDIRDDKNPLQKPTFLSKLKEDLKPGDFKGHHVAKMQTPTQFQNIKQNFINAILQNISDRFPDTAFLTSLSVLGLRPITFLGDKELHEWGNSEVEKLAEYYGKDREHSYKNPETKCVETYKSEAVVDPVGVKVEWQRLKDLVRTQQYPRPSMEALWQIISQYHRDQFPNLITLAMLALTHPVHTADCERTFSAQNSVTTPLRNRLSPENCSRLMKIMIEGPPMRHKVLGKPQKNTDHDQEIKEFDFVAAIVEYRNMVDRVIFK